MLRASPLRPKTAIAFIDDVMAKLQFAVERVETDNGSKFGASLWLNGKVERSHRINSEQFYRLLEGRVIDDVNVLPPSCKSGRTTTTTAHTEPAGQTSTNASDTKPRTRGHRPSSVADVSPIKHQSTIAPSGQPVHPAAGTFSTSRSMGELGPDWAHQRE